MAPSNRTEAFLRPEQPFGSLPNNPKNQSDSNAPSRSEGARRCGEDAGAYHLVDDQEDCAGNSDLLRIRGDRLLLFGESICSICRCCTFRGSNSMVVDPWVNCRSGGFFDVSSSRNILLLDQEKLMQDGDRTNCIVHKRIVVLWLTVNLGNHSGAYRCCHRASIDVAGRTRYNQTPSGKGPLQTKLSSSSQVAVGRGAVPKVLISIYERSLVPYGDVDNDKTRHSYLRPGQSLTPNCDDLQWIGGICAAAKTHTHLVHARTRLVDIDKSARHLAILHGQSIVL